MKKLNIAMLLICVLCVGAVALAFTIRPAAAGVDDTDPVFTRGDSGFWYVDGVQTSERWRAEIWTQDPSGYWWVDGVATNNRWLGEAGQTGPQGTPGQHAPVWTQGASGFWYLNGIRQVTRWCIADDFTRFTQAVHAARGVERLIDQLPTNIVFADRAQVRAARAAFNGLNDLARGFVLNLDILVAAELITEATPVAPELLFRVEHAARRGLAQGSEFAFTNYTTNYDVNGNFVFTLNVRQGTASVTVNFAQILTSALMFSNGVELEVTRQVNDLAVVDGGRAMAGNVVYGSGASFVRGVPPTINTHTCGWAARGITAYINHNVPGLELGVNNAFVGTNTVVYNVTMANGETLTFTIVIEVDTGDVWQNFHGSLVAIPNPATTGITVSPDGSTVTYRPSTGTGLGAAGDGFGINGAGGIRFDALRVLDVTFDLATNMQNGDAMVWIVTTGTGSTPQGGLNLIIGRHNDMYQVGFMNSWHMGADWVDNMIGRTEMADLTGLVIEFSNDYRYATVNGFTHDLGATMVGVDTLRGFWLHSTNRAGLEINLSNVVLGDPAPVIVQNSGLTFGTIQWEMTFANAMYFDGVDLQSASINFADITRVTYTFMSGSQELVTVWSEGANLVELEHWQSQWAPGGIIRHLGWHVFTGDAHAGWGGFAWTANTLASDNLPTSVVAEIEVVRGGITFIYSVTRNF